MFRPKPPHPAHVIDTDAERADSPDPSIRRRLFETISGPERYSLFADEVARAFELTTEQARRALCAIHDSSAWTRGALPGSRTIAIPELIERGVIIAELPLGMHIPVHAHGEREQTYVLDGELLDDQGQRFGPGQLVDMPTGSSHSITVTGSHACLAVFRSA